MADPKFIGTVSFEEIKPTINYNPWQPMHFDFAPYSVIKPSPSYLFTLGSGCLNSMATTSIFGHKYNSGIDVFRQDWNNGTAVIDVDHYVAEIGQASYNIFKYPPDINHHLKSNNKILQYIEPGWTAYVNKVLAGSMTL